MQHEYAPLGLCSLVRLLLHMHTSFQRFAAIIVVTLSMIEIPCLQHDHHQQERRGGLKLTIADHCRSSHGKQSAQTGKGQERQE